MQLSIDRYGQQSPPRSFFPPTYKIVLVGNFGVGKSAFLWRFLHKDYRPFGNVPVIDMEQKRITVKDKAIELELWDTAGQEKFCTLPPSYYQGAHGIIVIYDMTDDESFTDVKQYWMKEIFGMFGEDADRCMPIMLIGTKADLIDDHNKEIVQKKDMIELKKKYNRILGPYTCSAKTGENVDKAFLKLAEDLVIRDTIGFQSQKYKDQTVSSSCITCSQ